MNIQDNSGAQWIIDKYDSGVQNGQGYHVTLKSSGQVYWMVHDTTKPGGNWPFIITSDTTVDDGNWHMVTFVRDAGQDLAYIYIDGYSDAIPKIDNSTLTHANNLSLQIGRRRNNDTKYYAGSLDEIRISMAARSADWITASFNNQGDPTYLTFGLQETLIGTIEVNATLDGVDWSGSIDYSLTDAENINGSSTPATFSGKSVGQYTLTYNSGGPSGATLISIDPSATQTVGANGTITFTLNFISPPIAPSNLTATTISSTQIDLLWTDGSNNETGFKIERKIGVGGTYSQIAAVGIDVTFYSDIDLTTDTTYYYRVRTYNLAGESAYSNESNARTFPVLPDTPFDLRAIAISSTQIDLSWTDGSNNETGFKIERKIGVGGTYSQIAAVGVNVTTHLDSGLTPEITYYYRVRAYNSAGDSDYSTETYATTREALSPVATTNPATNVNGNSTTLNATVNPKGSETTVYFEWGTDMSYENNTSIQPIGTGISNVSVSANITGLSTSTTYYYRVVAANTNGTIDGNERSFTTPPITLTITSPLDGETINRPDVLVKSTVSNSTGNETGVTVNGIVATVMSLSNYNGEFFVNHVLLEEGQNTITASATDTSASGGGNTVSTSITVSAVTTMPHVTLRANIESGIAPLTTSL